MTVAGDEQFDAAVAGARAAAAAGLGPLRQHYDAGTKIRAGHLVAAVMCFVLGSGLLWVVAGSLLGIDRASGDGDPMLGRIVFGLLGILGLGMWVGAGVLVYGHFRPAEWWFGHFDGGVVVTRLGMPPSVLPWERIAQVTHVPTTVTLNGSSMGTHHALSFFFCDGAEPYLMEKLADADWGTIGPGVVTAFGRVAARRMVDEVRAGGVCRWGGLELSAAGIRSGHTSRPWVDFGAPRLVVPSFGAAAVEIVPMQGGPPLWRVSLGPGLDSTLIAGRELIATMTRG